MSLGGRIKILKIVIEIQRRSMKKWLFHSRVERKSRFRQKFGNFYWERALLDKVVVHLRLGQKKGMLCERMTNFDEATSAKKAKYCKT